MIQKFILLFFIPLFAFALESKDYNENPYMSQARRVILSTYGDNVSIGKKAKDLIKFGRATNIGSSARGTIWFTNADQQNEIYVASNTNSIDTISSGNSSDAVDVVIEGHTETAGNKTFVVQSATLNGQNKVSLDTPLNRVTRLYNANGTTLSGPVYVYENTNISSGKPSDTTKIHLTVAAGENQSEKASTALSSRDYWIVTSIHCHVLEKSANIFVDTRLEVRLPGGVFRPVDDITCTGSTPGLLSFRPYVIIPKNSDVRLTAQGSTTAIDVSGSIFGFLAIIED